MGRQREEERERQVIYLKNAFKSCRKIIDMS